MCSLEQMAYIILLCSLFNVSDSLTVYLCRLKIGIYSIQLHCSMYTFFFPTP